MTDPTDPEFPGDESPSSPGRVPLLTFLGPPLLGVALSVGIVAGLVERTKEAAARAH